MSCNLVELVELGRRFMVHFNKENQYFSSLNALKYYYVKSITCLCNGFDVL